MEGADAPIRTTLGVNKRTAWFNLALMYERYPHVFIQGDMSFPVVRGGGAKYNLHDAGGMPRFNLLSAQRAAWV